MNFENYFEQVQEAAGFLRSKTKEAPKLLVVLSGGLEPFTKGIKDQQIFPLDLVPHFPKTKAEGHKGKLIFGRYENLPIVVMQGRTHFYEGLTPQEVVFPYFVFDKLGAKFLVSTNAVGGIRLDLNVGDVMVVTDHINMMGTTPLIGLAVQQPTDQFISMQQAYDPKLIELVKEVARAKNIELKEGVFLGNPGPNYETPAEIKAYRHLGADTVGMSTIFEVIAARFLKWRTLVLNIIANPSSDRHTGVMTHTEVLKTMNKVQSKVVTLLEGVVSAIAKLT